MAPDNPGLIMPPPFFTAIAIVCAAGLEWIFPLDWFGEVELFSLRIWLGVGLMLSGGALIFPAIRLFREADTNVEPTRPAHTLVTAGWYRISRNPMYVGCLLFYTGLSLAAGLDWGVLILPLVWLAFDRLIVIREEAYLTGKFGADYEAFKRRTRRWL